MKFIPLPLDGAYLVEPAMHLDERGSFARLWDAAEFAGNGLIGTLAQSSLSTNPVKGTLRGLHFQLAPNEETKIVTCIRGSIWDVIVDLRPTSPSHLRWHGQILDSHELRSVYVPPQCAHGFLTLTDDVVVAYQISEPYVERLGRGVRWDDPAIGIIWPAEPVVVGARDRAFPNYGD
jgi:dTDP-4-dehydrorhamnose 3,5-epimerase